MRTEKFILNAHWWLRTADLTWPDICLGAGVDPEERGRVIHKVAVFVAGEAMEVSDGITNVHDALRVILAEWEGVQVTECTLAPQFYVRGQSS